LELKRKFWLLSEDQIKNRNKNSKEVTVEELPYFSSINELNKLQGFRNPREKLNCLLGVVSSLKSSIVDYHYGKVELESMDD
jgi:NifU-like protein involved in Fe-S cluster formation